MKMLSTIAVLALVLGVGGVMPVLADGQASISVSAPDMVVPGSGFMATVDITEVQDLNAVQYDIRYDSQVLRLDSVSEGQIASTTISAMSNEVGEGHWRVVQSMGLETISGSGNLATLHFHAIGAGGAHSDISITDGMLSDLEMNAIQATWGANTVHVISGESEEPEPIPESMPEPAPPSGPSSSLPSSIEPEAADGTVAEVESPAPLLPPAPGSGKKLEDTPEARAKVAEPAETPAGLLPPAPKSEPLRQPWIWAIAGGVIVIILLFIIIRLSRRPL
jgi:hypothetical protein